MNLAHPNFQRAILIVWTLRETFGSAERGGAARGGKNGVRTEVFGHLHPHMPLCTSTILRKIYAFEI